MPPTSAPANVLACFKTPAEVACHYQLGIIEESSALASILPDAVTCPPSGQTQKSLFWLFEERASESQFMALFAGKVPFCCLFRVVLELNHDDSALLIGQSGDGSMDPSDTGNSDTIANPPVVIHDGPPIVIVGPDPSPIYILHWLEGGPFDLSINSPVLREGLPIGFSSMPAFAPALFQIRPTVSPAPKLVHITQPNYSILRLYDSNRFNGSDIDATCRNMLAHLSALPDDEINSHGVDSGDAANQAIQCTGLFGNPTPYPISYVSSFYPDFYATGSPVLGRPPQIIKSSFKPHLAFSSSTILNLKPGDVLFISQSFGSRDSFGSMLFDLSVYKITQWLECRGVTVVFSVGNTTQLLNPNSELLPLPGILVGGIDKNPSGQYNITSNYGDLITCYGLPVQLSDGPFDASSGATAYTAGLVVSMQIYAKSKSRFLLPSEIRDMLRQCGQTVSLSGITLHLTPDWNSLKQAIDLKFH